MCNGVEFLFDEDLNSFTFNFGNDPARKWFEFYITTKTRLGIHQIITTLIILNGGIMKLQVKD